MLKLLPALALIAFVLPSSAFGQATRTWVSGVGDDVNPCSRTAPCKTFAGAISKTAAGGEINVLDPGGFGGVTITKSLTIDGGGIESGVLVGGTNGIIVNDTTNPGNTRVTLKGLDINGTGAGLSRDGQVGIKVLSGARVNIKDSEIYGFQDGVAVMPSSATPRVNLKNNHIHDNGIGVINAPTSNTPEFSLVTLRNNDIEDNYCGAVTSSNGPNNATTPNPLVDCGTQSTGPGVNNPTIISAFHNSFNDNNFPGSAPSTVAVGVYSRGPGALFEIGWNEITGNSVAMLRPDSALIRTFTPATNVISQNGGAGDAPNSSVPLTRPMR
jgi:hypothetical protein